MILAKKLKRLSLAIATTLLAGACTSFRYEPPASFRLSPIPDGSGILVTSGSLFYCGSGHHLVAKDFGIFEAVEITKRGGTFSLVSNEDERVSFRLRRESDGFRMDVTDSAGKYTSEAHISSADC